MDTAIKRPAPDRVKPSFVFLTSGHSDAQPWASDCPRCVKNYKYKWRLNPIWHVWCFMAVPIRLFRTFWEPLKYLTGSWCKVSQFPVPNFTKYILIFAKKGQNRTRNSRNHNCHPTTTTAPHQWGPSGGLEKASAPEISGITGLERSACILL